MSTNMDYEINKELGECYLFMGDFAKARDYYGKARQAAPEMADSYMGLATVAVQLGELDEAHAMYSKAAELAPSDKSLAGMGLVEMEQGKHEAAFAHFTEALGFNQSNMVAINGLVQEGYFLGRLGEIVPQLEKALATNDMESLRYTLAGCLTALGREIEAKSHLEALLAANPSHESAQELYARFAA